MLWEVCNMCNMEGEHLQTRPVEQLQQAVSFLSSLPFPPNKEKQKASFQRKRGLRTVRFFRPFFAVETPRLNRAMGCHVSSKLLRFPIALWLDTSIDFVVRFWGFFFYGRERLFHVCILCFCWGSVAGRNSFCGFSRFWLIFVGTLLIRLVDSFIWFFHPPIMSRRIIRTASSCFGFYLLSFLLLLFSLS